MSDGEGAEVALRGTQGKLCVAQMLDRWFGVGEGHDVVRRRRATTAPASPHGPAEPRPAGRFFRDAAN